MRLKKSETKLRIVNVGHYDDESELRCLPWPLADIEFVEDLMYDVLDHLKVGLVCRPLFGVKLTSGLWLAPNTTITQLDKLIRKRSLNHPNEVHLYVQMRFRPACYSRLFRTDKRAFDLIFSQIKYDFLHTRFGNQKRDRILFDNSVLGLIATDLLRFAMIKNLKPQEALEVANPDKFIPRRVMKWQRVLLFLFGDKLKIKQSMETILEKCNNDISKVKQGFIELFLQEVHYDYGSETFTAFYFDKSGKKIFNEVRIRYEQKLDTSNFIIERRPIKSNQYFQDSSREWDLVCDINSTCYGSLRDASVEINLMNESPLKLSFENDIIARSFLSGISGYYRLMKKWNFSFCRAVINPNLDRLRQMKCHGPIGYQTMLVRLSHTRPGTFLIRQCAENADIFKIDVSIDGESQLTIVIVRNSSSDSYSLMKYSSSQRKDLKVRLDKQECDSLKSCIDNLQIGSSERDNLHISLKHWLIPIESDDCPSLLLSITNKKLVELIPKNNGYLMRSTDDLPKVIPFGYLNFLNDRPMGNSNNGTVAKKAKLTAEQVVIVKDLNQGQFGSIEPARFLWDISEIRRNSSTKQNLSMSQVRLEDWAVVKHSLFAETIGISFMGSPLIQEYFDKGRLDEYLSNDNHAITELEIHSIVGQLAFAVVYLQEKQIIHGKLRCHNVFIHKLNPIKIKITDPFGTVDGLKDKAFLPPEYFGLNGVVTLQQFDRSIDLWALGTTLWQVFSRGKRPPHNTFANKLEKPESCKDATWTVIQSCWVVNPCCQISSQTVYRDLKDSLVWQLEIPGYHYINISRNDMITDRAEDNSSFQSIDDRRTSINSSNYVATFKNRNRSFKDAWSIIKFNKSSLRKESFIYESSDNSISSISVSEITQTTDLIASPSLCGDSFDFYSHNIAKKDLTFGPEIGTGSCGIVKRAGLKAGMGYISVAIKCVNNSRGKFREKAKDLEHEFEILRKLDHPNIIKVLGFVKEETNMLVLEYMSLGSLLSVLRNMKLEQFLKTPLLLYSLDIAKGMEYLESMNVVHCDLALRNILINDEDIVKICDFGFSRRIKEPGGYYELDSGKAFPCRWYPPESLEQNGAPRIFSSKSDVWSFGIVLWEMYSGGSNPQYPEKYSNMQETIRNARLEKPDHCPQEIYDLMLKCWTIEPDIRPSFKEIRQCLEYKRGSSSTACHATNVK